MHNYVDTMKVNAIIKVRNRVDAAASTHKMIIANVVKNAILNP